MIALNHENKYFSELQSEICIVIYMIYYSYYIVLPFAPEISFEPYFCVCGQERACRGNEVNFRF